MKPVQRKKPRWGAGLWVAVSAVLILVVVVMLIQAREKARRFTCAGNLKGIGFALRMYSSDWGGRFPPYDGARGLEILRSQGYLDNPQIYTFPSSNTVPATEGQPLTEDTVDYHYHGGLTEAHGIDFAIAWDKDLNHAKYGNVLHIDGDVTGYGGIFWKSSAGISTDWTEP